MFRISNPVYSSSDGKSIDVLLKLDGEVYPFTAIDGSGEDHTQAIWDYVIAGEAGAIAEFVAPPDPTAEEIRAKMPRLSMVDFRRKLRGIRTETVTDGIYEEDILEKINLIADKDLAAEARDYFLYAQYIERINPWVEILGSMFGLTPEDIDVLWVGDNES